MKEIVRKFLKGVPVELIVGFLRQHALDSLKNPSAKGYQAAQDELIALAKDVQAKWPEKF